MTTKNRANVVVLVDPGFPDQNAVVEELKNWDASVIFTVLDLYKGTNYWLFDVNLGIPQRMYLIENSRSHGRSGVAFAISRAFWKVPVTLIHFSCGALPSDIRDLVVGLCDSNSVLFKEVGVLTNTPEPGIIEDRENATIGS